MIQDVINFAIAHKEPLLVVLLGVSELLAFTKVGGVAKIVIHGISWLLSSKKK